MPVEFTDETNLRAATNNVRPPSGLTGWLIRRGIAKNVAGANVLMTIVALVCVAIGVWFALK